MVLCMQNRGSTRRPVLRRRVGAVALAAAVLVAAVFVYLYAWRPAPVPSPAPSAAVPPDPTPPLVSAAPPERLPAPEVPLPPIAESDPFVRGLVSGISANPQLSRWLVTDELIRRFAAVVANISLGESPSAHLDFLAPDERFADWGDGGRALRRSAELLSVRSAGGRLCIARRAWDRAAVQDCASAYRGGISGSRLRRRLRRGSRAGGRALAGSPGRPGQSPREPGGRDLWSDPELEGLDAAQRHFLRMGPRNVRMVQTKLRELGLALGIPVPQP